MFSLLVVLWCIPFFKHQMKQKKAFIAVFLLTIMYGITMEFVQKYFTADRSFDLTDIAADIIGAICGLGFVRILKRKKLLKNKPL